MEEPIKSSKGSKKDLDNLEVERLIYVDATGLQEGQHQPINLDLREGILLEL